MSHKWKADYVLDYKILNHEYNRSAWTLTILLSEHSLADNLQTKGESLDLRDRLPELACTSSAHSVGTGVVHSHKSAPISAAIALTVACGKQQVVNYHLSVNTSTNQNTD